MEPMARATVHQAKLREHGELLELGEQYQRLRDQMEEVRERLVPAIRAAAADGVAQGDMVKATGYTREAVRRIADPKVRERVNASYRRRDS